MLVEKYYVTCVKEKIVMSRIGKSSITVPTDVQCRLEDNYLIAKGRLGEAKVFLEKNIFIKFVDNKLYIEPVNDKKEVLMMWGTFNRLASNVIDGVSKGFTRNLEITGVGYRASIQGSKLVLQLGYSHDIEFLIPLDINIKCDKPTSISISGIDKQRVGQIAAKIRSYRKPEPYKGKGIRYDNEKIIRKEGKKK